MRKLILNVAAGVGVWLICMLPHSCIDMKYDLAEEVDKTVAVGGQYPVIPLGDTEKLYLRKFVKTDNAGLLDTIRSGQRASEYVLSKKDDLNPIKINSSEMNILVPELALTPISFPVFLLSLFSPVSVDLDDPDSALAINFKMENEAISPDIKEVRLLTLKEDSKGKYIELIIKAENLAQGDWVDLSQTAITFPSFVIFTPKQSGLDYTANRYQLSEGNTKTAKLSQGKTTYTKRLDIKGFEFKNGEGKVQTKDGKRILTIAGDAKISGSVAVSVDRTSALLPGRPDNASIFININVYPAPLQIASITGVLQPAIQPVPVLIPLEGLPDFLRGDEVRMDLVDPRLTFHIHNPLDMSLLINARLQGIKHGQRTHTENIQTGTIEIPARQSITLHLSGTDTTPEAAAGNTKNIQIKNLNQLFLVVPDSIQIDVDAAADETKLPHSLTLGQENVIKLDYGVEIPLTFGKNLLIVYQETLTGWNKDIESLGRSTDRIHIEAEVENTIPLELRLSGYAIDKAGKKLPGITFQTQNNQAVKPCNPDGSASITPIVIEVTNDNKDGNLVKQIDGAVLIVKANTTETTYGKPLKSSQYLQLRKIKAGIPGGLSIDLN